MSRVVWTHEEKKAVLDHMVYHLTANPTLTNKQVLQQSQTILPYERRVKVTDQRVFNHKERILKARTEAAKLRATADEPVTIVPGPIEPAPAPTPSIGSLFEQLVDAITQRVTDRVLARLSEQTEALPRATLDDAFGHPLDKLDDIFNNLYPEFKKAPIVPRKPSCLIIGLNGAQMQSIRDRVKHVDFKFLTAEEAVSHYKCVKDHTILMTKFLNHSAQGKYRKHPNLHYCNGGVSELNTLLNGIFKEQTA